MKFSQAKHFKKYDDCAECNGNGRIDKLEAHFNVKTMDFDVVTDVLCPSCLNRSKEDFYSYLEDKEE